MTGSFSSFGTALSALRHTRVALDVASNNIANQTTAGFARRRVEAQTIGGPVQPALWSRYDGVGDGVTTGALTRMSDSFLDLRARREHGAQSSLDVRATVLDRVEAGVGEPGENGVAAALVTFRAAFHDLATDPSAGSAPRSQILALGASLADAIHGQATTITAEMGDQRARLQSTVGEANDVASDLAATNRSLAAAHLNGTDASVLLDQRDQLALRLSELTGAEATTRPDGGLDVTVGGVALVTGGVAGRLGIASGVTSTGASDGAPITFSVTTGGTTVAVAGRLGGEAGGVTDLLTTTLPNYLAGLNTVARELADTVNATHQAGYDIAGGAGQAFFSYDASAAATSLSVAITDPDLVAASSTPGGNLDGSNAQRLSLATPAEASYQRLVNGLGSEVASVKRLAATQQLLTTQVDSSREQLSGVNVDEETVNMLAAQRGYEAAARVMTVMDSVLDTLINRTGLVR